MSADVISLLQAVKHAEEEKSRAIAEAKAAAAERVRLAEQAAAGCDAAVRERVAAEESRLKTDAEEAARRELQLLESRHSDRVVKLQHSADARREGAAAALQRWFLNDLTAGPGAG